MALKSTIGASVLLVACAALGGCQTSPPRPNPSGFTQRPGSSNPPVVYNNQQSTPPGLAAPVNSTSSTVNGVPNVVPNTAPNNLNGNFRTTASPSIPSNVTSNVGMGAGNFGVNPPPPLSPSATGAGFDNSIAPPPNNGPSFR